MNNNMTIDKNSLIRYSEDYIKYAKDPIAFIEDQIKIPLPGGVTKFRLYNRQKELIKKFMKYHNIIVLKSRQIGVSTVVQALIAWMVTFYDNVVIGVISRDGPEATDFARKTMMLLDELPPEYKPVYEKKTEQTFILDNQSALYVGAVNASKPGAVLRGKALTLLVVDEAAFVSNMEEAHTAIVPALSKTHAVAKKRGIPYGTIIMSTPNGTVREGEWFYQTWKFALQSPGDPFYPMKIHWKDIPEFANDTSWYEKQCQLLKYDKRKIGQELDLVFVSPSTSFLDPDTCSLLQKVVKDPDDIIKVTENNRTVGELWIWNYDNIDPENVVIGVDTATAYGSSRSAVQIFDVVTMTQIAELDMKGKVTTLNKVINDIIMPMFPKALLVIEANSVGNQVIEFFSDSQWALNLYYRHIQNPKLQIKEFRPGLVNDNKVRPLLIDSLYTCVTQFPDGIKSRRLVTELIGLEEKHGKVLGSPDDLCLAYSFVSYVRQYASKYITSKAMTKESVDAFNEIILEDDITDPKDRLKTYNVQYNNVQYQEQDVFDDYEFVSDFSNIFEENTRPM